MNRVLAWVGAWCALILAPATMTLACATPTDHAHDVVVTAAPAQAYQTLKKIDAGTWPATATPGTKGGQVWQNREHRLPARDSRGQSVTYREWDVNNKIQGRNRDAERIITGSDHSAWYTGDHYQTFERMR